jgi:hypothetical protein
MLSIRPANAADVPTLNTLIHEFAAFERLPIAATEAGLLRDGFSESPKFRVLMAEWDGLSAMLFSSTTIPALKVAPDYFLKTFTFATNIEGRELGRYC